jgi:glycosyltransferase involved in cell wall biosynthesis
VSTYRITVGLPVCNSMPYLVAAMESLTAQTVHDFDILAIIDGGDDGSLAYLKSQQFSWRGRLRILSQPNQGLVITLNRMLRACPSSWMARQDSDDVSHPERMEKLLAAIERHPGAGMFHSLANYHPRHAAVGAFRSSRASASELRRLTRSGYVPAICHPTAVLNVEKSLALGGYRLGLHNEDSDLWWRMALAHDIHCIPEELVGFRQNSGSVSSRHLSDQMVGGLYVQYLLLSHLRKRLPRALGDVREQLEGLIPAGEVSAKERLRACNMLLAEKKTSQALLSLAQSLFASPRYLFARIWDELMPGRAIANGIPPQLFMNRKEVLWP